MNLDESKNQKNVDRIKNNMWAENEENKREWFEKKILKDTGIKGILEREREMRMTCKNFANSDKNNTKNEFIQNKNINKPDKFL